MKKIILFSLLFMAVPAFATTPQTVTISPTGGTAEGGTALQVGSSMQFHVVAHYPGGSPADDDCTAAGGATWSSSRDRATMSGTGLYTWISDPGAGVTDWGYAVVSCDGVSDEAAVFVQHVGDTFYQYPTPDTSNYTLKSIPINLVVGAEATIGSAIKINVADLSGPIMNPFTNSCNWSSSNTGVATVDNIGHVTGVAAGTVTITCDRIGDAVYGTSTASGWTSPGNVINLTVIAVPATSPQTWYVRPGGGSIYNASTSPFGMCTGLTDADYPGPINTYWLPAITYATNALVADRGGHYWKATTGGVSAGTSPAFTSSPVTDNTVVWTEQGTYPVDQDCALDNLRSLWADNYQYEVEAWTPAFHGGDTVIIRQNTDGYNSNLDTAAPSVGGTSWIPANCAGDMYCGMPTIPSGSAAHHTRILGENSPLLTGVPTSCRTDAAKTLLDVTYYGAYAFADADSQYVDVSCFYVTDRSDCADGSDSFPNVCHNSAQDFGRLGIDESALSSEDTVSDVFFDGLSIGGIYGASADLTTVFDHVRIRGGGSSTASLDDSPWDSGNISVSGGITMTNTSLEWSGCAISKGTGLTYPIFYCVDQQLGGYGDAFGTGSTSGDWLFDHDTFEYAWQDGLDLLHSGMRNLTVTNSISTGNLGQAYKLGDAKNVTYENNIAVTDCYRLSVPVGDQPASSIPAPGLGVGYCRAEAGVVIPLNNLGTIKVIHNAYFGYQDTSYILNTASGWDSANNANSIFQDNVHIGYGNPLNSQVLPGVFYSTSGTFPSGYFNTRTYNQYAGGRGGGPGGLGTGEFIGDPGYAGAPAPGSAITDETVFDGINFAVPSGSNIQYTGITAGAATDQAGNAWHVPPSMGALEFEAGPATAAYFTGHVVLSGSVQIQ